MLLILARPPARPVDRSRPPACPAQGVTFISWPPSHYFKSLENQIGGDVFLALIDVLGKNQEISIITLLQNGLGAARMDGEHG